MPLRVYCPDCSAPRTAPERGARVRCRNCDRVFRAGTRAERRAGRRDDPDEPADASGARNLLLVLGGVAVLLFGLAIGGGLVAWYFLIVAPDREPADEEVIAEDEGPPPPPVVQPVPFNPQPPANPPDDPP